MNIASKSYNSLELSSGSVEAIKWTAIAAMTLDHIGKILLNGFYTDILSAIGRIAFPLFAFLIAHNYIHFTKNKKAYIGRLFLFGIISQPVYQLALNRCCVLNILFTLGTGVLAYYLLERSLIGRKKERMVLLFLAVVALFPFILFLGEFLEYRLFGVGVVLSMFAFALWPNIITMFLGAIFVYLANFGVYYAIFGLFSFLFIFYFSRKSLNLKRVGKWFFYVYYPMHLAVLYTIE